MTERKTVYALILIAALVGMIVCLTPQCALTPSPSTTAAQAQVIADQAALVTAQNALAAAKAAAATQPASTDLQTQLAVATANNKLLTDQVAADAAALAKSKTADNNAAGVTVGNSIAAAGPIAGVIPGYGTLIGAILGWVGVGIAGVYAARQKSAATASNETVDTVTAIAQQAVGITTNIVHSLEAGKAAPGGVVLTPVAVAAIDAVQTPETKAAVNAVQAGLPTPLQAKLDAATA